MKRRTLLASFGTVGATTLAGCLDSLGFGESTTTLRQLTASNFDTSSEHTYDVRLERDGTVVHESTLTVEAAEESITPSQSVDCNWDAVPGSYTVSARVDDGEWQSFDVLEHYDTAPECVMASVTYDFDSDGTPHLWLSIHPRCEGFNIDPGYCAPTTTTAETE